MNVHEDFWYRTLFKIKLYEASGDSFQKLFQDIMVYRDSNFQSIAPYGNWGDGGNDGWIPSENRYFQVYGSKPNTKVSPVDACNKATGDFDKLKQKWPEVQYYHFVYNDRYIGSPAPISSTLAQLKQVEKLSEASILDSAKLETYFMLLDNSHKSAILGSIPSEIPEFIDPTSISELLVHLADKVSPLLGFLNETSPDFDEKIKLNGISEPVNSSLKTFFYQSADVDEFLSKRDQGLTQKISGEMQSMYNDSKNCIPDSEQFAANMRYVWMVEQLIPPQAKEHPHSLKAYRDAAQVILAKYFETCDAYEHPKHFTAP